MKTDGDDRFLHTPVPTSDPRRFQLPVVPDVLVGPPERQFMMGGVGLGSAIAALESATSRPLVWATAQYLSFAPPGSTVDIHVHVPVEGRTVTQARVTSRVGDREILTVNAALGSREGLPSDQYVAMPDLPPPEDCERVEPHFPALKDLHARIERRAVPATSVDHEGHARTWMRAVDDAPVTAGFLAVFADFLPGAIPVTRGSSSLDNTLRIRCLQPTRWCLLDARIQGLGSGFFHGETCIFAEDGTLLATASQSGALAREAR